MKTISIFLIAVFFPAIFFAQEFVWAKQLGGTGSQVPESIITDADGNVYTTGWFRGTVDFDPGPGIFNLPCNPEPGTDLTENDMFISKLDADGNFVWAKKVSGDGMQNGLFMALDTEQNLYITGQFSHTVDFDPGPATYNLTSSFYDVTDNYCANMFLMKLDNAGNFMWAFGVGGESTGGQLGQKIVLDDAANVYVTGYYSADADFDPGAGVAMLECAGIWDVYIAKYDTDGNYTWAKQLGGTGHELSYSLARDIAGNIITSGYFYGTGDYDPGPGEVILTADATSDFELFLSKLDSDGNFVWVNHFIGDNDAGSKSVITDGNDIILFGDYNGIIDADAGPEVTELTSAGGTDFLVAKYNSDGALLWAKSVGGLGNDVPLEGAVDEMGNIYFTGYFNNTVDFDPGPGIFNLTAVESNGFICKWDAAGNFIWAANFGDDGGDLGKSIYLDSLFNIYLTGYFDNTVDFNPGPEYFPLTCSYDDIFVLKLTQDYCSGLTLIADTIGDIECGGTPALLGGHADGGQTPYTYVWNTTPVTYDSVATTPLGGFVQFTVTDAIGCERAALYLVDGPTALTGFDLQSNLILEDILFGFESNIWLDVFNNGCIATDGYVDVVLPVELEYVDAIPAPDIIIGDTLRWLFSDMQFSDPHFTAQIIVTTSVYATLGEWISIKTIARPLVDDEFPGNNVKNYVIPITGSYDPNDKSVYPQGICDDEYILNSDTLTYTIRFQNTGTAEAINIFILDTLSTLLDINTFKIVASSHAMVTELLPDNVLKFKFDNIYLPDSGANEIESHGYVIFEILPLPDLANFSVIDNNAAIYFDFNEPIITNSTHNTLLDELPILAVSQEFSICEGDFVTVNGNNYNAVGIYIDTLISTFGCDSIVTTNIMNVNPAQYITNTVNICEGEVVTVGDNTYATTGLYTDNFTNIFGCDSVILTDLTVHPTFTSTIAAELCEGETYVFNGITLSSPGLYYANLLSHDNCDSIVELTLTYHTVDAGITATEFTLTANNAAASYQWVDCENNFAPIPDATNQTFEPVATGLYALIINDGLCTDTSACYFIDKAGITLLQDETFAIYPNPAQNELQIFSSYTQSQGIDMYLYNITNQLVSKYYITTFPYTLNISELESGMYILSIHNNDDNQYFRFIKE